MGINIKVNDGKTIKLYHLEGILNVGRSSKNDIIIKNPKVSKFHAQLVLDLTGRVFIKDMFSLNGTILNSGHVTMEPLLLGDVVLIWDVELCIDETNLDISSKKKLGRRTSGPQKLEVTLRYSDKKGTKTTKQEAGTALTKVKKPRS